jgi:tetratricopeptide (TPR) repeat protein
VLKHEKDSDLTKSAISLFTNRSLCYQKKNLDANVIADTTDVIDNLTQTNVKAYFRRATSYKNFGQYKDSLADLNKALEIEPKNADAKKLHKEVKELFEKELQKQFEKQKKTAAPTEPKCKVKEIKDIIGPKVQEIKPGEEVKRTDKTITEPKKRVKIDDEIIEKAAEIATKEIGKDKIRIPTTSYGFEADVNSLKKDDSKLYNYVTNIPPSTYSKIYKSVDIQPDYLVCILGSLDKHEKDSNKILHILYNFSLAQNISMTMMFLNDDDQKLLERLFEKAENATDGNKAQMLKKAKSMLD